MARINWKLISNNQASINTYLLDELTDKPLRAFSFFKLTSTPYTNLCIEVFKDNGQSLAIQYKGDFLNVKALLDFANGGNCWVSKWYCQLTGIALNQTANSNRRFKIVSNGQLVINEGSLAMTNDNKHTPPCYMFCEIPLPSTNPEITVSSVASFKDNISDTYLCWIGSDASGNNISYSISGFGAGIGQPNTGIRALLGTGFNVSNIQVPASFTYKTDITKKTSFVFNRKANKLKGLINDDFLYKSNDDINETSVNFYNNLYLGSNNQSSKESVNFVSELLVWGKSINQTDVTKISKSTLNRYRINSEDFIFSNEMLNVSEAKGIADKLEAKETLSFDWKDEHGIQYDTKNIFYNPRKIELVCNMICNDFSDYLNKTKRLNDILGNADSLFLIADFSQYGNDIEPLIFSVLSFGSIEHDKKWRNTKFVTEFSINLIENRPVKLILKKEGAGLSYLNISTNEIIEIIDLSGQKTVLTGQNKVFEKNSLDDEYFILSGNIKNVSINETNLNISWKILN